MIKKLLNYIRREDEIKALQREVNRLNRLFNREVEINRRELSRLEHSMIAVQAREELLVDEVIRLQERNIYEH
jgi:hypothetical protein